jgi:hypothetical protein
MSRDRVSGLFLFEFRGDSPALTNVLSVAWWAGNRVNSRERKCAGSHACWAPVVSVRCGVATPRGLLPLLERFDVGDEEASRSVRVHGRGFWPVKAPNLFKTPRLYWIALDRRARRRPACRSYTIRYTIRVCRLCH